MMTLSINFNETNQKDMVAFANCISELAKLGINYTVGSSDKPIAVSSASSVSAPVSTPVSTPKTSYVATKDFVPKYEIKKQTSVSGEELFCISRKNGWTKAEKRCMNNAIKSLKNIQEIDVEYVKDGVKRTFKAWGYKTENTASKHLKELPQIFTVDQLNG